MKDVLKQVVFIPVKLPDGKQIGERYNVFLFPTFLVLDSGGETVLSWVGYHGPDSWVEIVSGLVADKLTDAERLARFEADPTYEDAISLANTAYAGKRFQDAINYFRRATELDGMAAKSGGVPIQVFRVAYYGAGAGDLSTDQCGAIAEEILTAEDVRPQDALEISEHLARVADQVGHDLVANFLTLAYPTIEGDTLDADQERRQEFLINYALLVDGNLEKAFRLKVESLPKEWKRDPIQLNSFAWWCFENRVDLADAEDLARQAVSLCEPGREKANIMDTLAELVNLRGDTAGALAVIESALEMDPENQQLQKQLKRFEGARLRT
jgi:tetratricopeptide (TPR) repeat protein